MGFSDSYVVNCLIKLEKREHKLADFIKCKLQT